MCVMHGLEPFKCDRGGGGSKIPDCMTSLKNDLSTEKLKLVLINLLLKKTKLL